MCPDYSLPIGESWSKDVHFVVVHFCRVAALFFIADKLQTSLSFCWFVRYLNSKGSAKRDHTFCAFFIAITAPQWTGKKLWPGMFRLPTFAAKHIYWLISAAAAMTSVDAGESHHQRSWRSLLCAPKLCCQATAELFSSLFSANSFHFSLTFSSLMSTSWRMEGLTRMRWNFSMQRCTRKKKQKANGWLAGELHWFALLCLPSSWLSWATGRAPICWAAAAAPSRREWPHECRTSDWSPSARRSRRPQSDCTEWAPPWSRWAEKEEEKEGGIWVVS